MAQAPEVELPGLEDIEEAILPTPRLVEALRSGLVREDPAPALLQLAQFFRDQSALLLRQATALEEMAIRDDLPETNHSVNDLYWQRNVLHLSTQTRNVIAETHHTMDDMEKCLVPWDIALAEASKVNPNYTRMSGYQMFVKENAGSLTKYRCSSSWKEMAATWRALPKEEQAVYHDKATQFKKNIEEKRRKWRDAFFGNMEEAAKCPPEEGRKKKKTKHEHEGDVA